MRPDGEPPIELEFYGEKEAPSHVTHTSACEYSANRNIMIALALKSISENEYKADRRLRRTTRRCENEIHKMKTFYKDEADIY